MNPKLSPQEKRRRPVARMVRAGLAGLVAAATMAGAASGCLDRPVAQQEPETTNIFVESFSNTEIDKIDLLFMIDNSISMADKQLFFAEAVPQLVNRLIDPICVPSESPNSMGVGGCPAGQEPEFRAINDINIGIVTSSLGGQPQNGESSGTISGVCADGEADKDNNDLGHLIGSLPRGNMTGANAQGFLSWGGPPQDPGALTTSFANMVQASGEKGCGFEATLEAWYRFLVDPIPGARLINNGGFIDYERNANGERVVDDVVLAQRAAFLRPDSLVAIIMLSDENDCSIAVPGLGWAVTQGARMFKATAACSENPNSLCCRSCGLAEEAPPQGCGALAADPGCADGGRYANTEDNPNVRCFNQKRRFGLDLLYPTARYSVGLLKAELCPYSRYGDADCECAAAIAQNPNASCTDQDVGPRMPNPLYSGQGASGLVRDPSLVYLAGIVGVPWQDIATEATRDAEGQLQYMTAQQLEATGAWGRILGDPATGAQPSNVFMQESIPPRAGVAGPDSARWANPVNSHEYLVPNNGDLQYACVFELPPKDCVAEEMAGRGCDCGPGSADPAQVFNPLCQAPDGTYGSTQYMAKGYPGLRELDVLKRYGQNSIVGSICPKVTSGDGSASAYGYNPAVAAIIDRLKEALRGRCLPRELVPEDNGEVPCRVVEAIGPGQDGSCRVCADLPGHTDVNPELVPPVLQLLREEGKCDAVGRPACTDMCLCAIVQPAGDELTACQNNPTATGFNGFCYVDPAAGAGNNEELVNACPPSQRRILRFADGTLLNGSTTFIACAGATFRTSGDDTMPDPNMTPMQP